jgi:putative hydrolase of the HAD superfamily
MAHFVYTQTVRITAVAFDIDGTLYPDAALRLRLIPFAFANLGFLMAFSAARRELHGLAAAGGSASGAPHDLATFRRLQASLVARRLGGTAEEAAALAERTVYGRLEEHFSMVPLFRGLRAALATLESAGFDLAVLSDFPASRKLEVLGIAPFFKVMRSTEEFGLLKPDPGAFTALARELGRPPAEILYVGNSPRYDVAGARSAGMRAALKVNRGAPLKEPKAPRFGGADFVFSDYRDLAEYVLASR